MFRWSIQVLHKTPKSMHVDAFRGTSIVMGSLKQLYFSLLPGIKFRYGLIAHTPAFRSAHCRSQYSTNYN